MSHLRELKFDYSQEKLEKFKVMLDCIITLKVHPESQISKINKAVENIQFVKNKRQKF